LTYDPGNPRNVTLAGEAFFDVRKDESVPFWVETPSGMKVKVTGTRFNLQSYPGDPVVETTLEEGKVIWVSNVPEEVNAKYVAFFNLNDNQSVSMEISFLVLGLKDTCKIRDLWKKKNIGTYKCNYSTKVEPHAAKIVKIKQIKCTI